MSATAEFIKKTTDSETELLEREGRIERAQRNAYYEIGLELKTIRDSGLYKVQRSNPVANKYSFTTFEEYVENRWGWSRERGRQLINASDVAAKLPTNVGILPAAESHVRELLKLETDEDRAIVWQQVVVSGQTITAHIVSDEVQRYLAAKSKEWVTLDEWGKLNKNEQLNALQVAGNKTLNKQDNDSIEWARWSWNPITGCRHDCPYCYARDIANRFYPQKFEPSIYPGRFSALANTKVPDQADSDISYRNVFACSMADLFGRWVPSEWIEKTLQTVADNPQWNVLFLTKFPKRMAEFDIPDNAWMGTTVDCQARVKAAEDAFSKVNCGIKWLSVEPMLEPLKFKTLEMFNWVVIGGASRSNETPEWNPPIQWLIDMHLAARDADCAIYYKSNSGLSDMTRIKEFPWGEKQKTPNFAPEAFKYLGK